MQTTTATSLLLPPPLAADLTKHSRSEVGTGESGATVLRFDRPNGTTVFLKSRAVATGSSARPLFDEGERLGDARSGLPVPAVLQYHEWKGHEYLLMTAVPGQMPPPNARRSSTARSSPRSPRECALCTPPTSAPARSTSRDGCGWRRRRRPCARGRSSSRISTTSVSVARRRSLAELTAASPPAEQRGFTHGDYCLPNVLLVDDGAGGFRISGFVDCGNAGIADPYQDLALCARSVAQNLGAEWVPALFARYGLERVDEEKVAYYQLLDEFF